MTSDSKINNHRGFVKIWFSSGWAGGRGLEAVWEGRGGRGMGQHARGCLVHPSAPVTLNISSRTNEKSPEARAVSITLGARVGE